MVIAEVEQAATEEKAPGTLHTTKARKISWAQQMLDAGVVPGTGPNPVYMPRYFERQPAGTPRESGFGRALRALGRGARKVLGRG